MTQWSHEVSINLTFGMYLQSLVHVIPRVFTNTVSWNSELSPRNKYLQAFFDWLIHGGGGGVGGRRGLFYAARRGNAICDLKTQELIIGGKIVSTIFHHLHWWSGMMWLFLAGLCTSSFFKLLFYCFRSKNVSGKDSSQGSTRLPPIPKVAYPRFQQKQYQHFNMNYSHVQPFR